MITLGAPPAGEPAWSVVTLAERLHVRPIDLFETLIRPIRNDDEHIEADLRVVFRADLDFPDRGIDVPPWEDAIPDVYITDRSVQYALCRFRDGVHIPAAGCGQP